MPGNEFGERVHNFFEQDGLSQDRNQSQVVDRSWSSFSNDLVGNQRQIDPSLIGNLKSFSTQQSVDPQRGQPSQQGLNFTQQPIRPEFSRSLLQEHQQPTNGYMKNLVSQVSPKEANFLGVDAESARGFTSDLHKLPMRFEMRESPVNYDVFGGQQQLSNQLPGMLQPLPTQQMTFNDMQLLKQQAMVKQMHDYQMQQQLLKQQLEARQLNSLNSNGSRSSDNQSHPLINGIPLQDASSNYWQRDLMTGNSNWMHRGISPVVQGSCSGLMITPEHGQADLSAQQFEPSLYSMPVGGGYGPQNAFSSVQMNRLAAQHGSADRNSSLTNQPTSFLNQGDVHDNQLLPLSTYQEKQLFSHSSVPGSNNRPNFESVQQDDSRERNGSVQEKFGQIEGSGLSEKSFMKAPENRNELQNSTTLDPTEEKILFGSDDNLWEAFGNSTDMSLTGNLVSNSSGLFEACPSLQSGRWSALMQSALAETSSDDAGVHEWANISTGPDANSHGVKAPSTPSEGFHTDSTRTSLQHVQDKGNKVSSHGLVEKPMDQHSQMSGNMFHSSSSGFDWQSNMSSNLNGLALMEQKNHLTQNLQMQQARYGAGNDSSASRDLQGNIQQHLDNNSVGKTIPELNFRDNSQILQSDFDKNSQAKASIIANNVMVESNEMGNCGKGQSSDSFLSKVSPESFTGFKETTQVIARDFPMVPGGKETQSPSRSDGLLTDGSNHKESVNYMLPSGQIVSQSFSINNHSALADADRHQESSKYSQCGTSTNRLVQPVNDTGIFTPMKMSEQYSVHGLHSVLSSKQISMQQMSGSTPRAETPSSDSLPHDVTNKLLKADKPKKRKASISWNKVVQGPQKLKTLGEAEIEWARATNRFSEKVNFVTSLDDVTPIKTKRRLIYTTQLIQQLFCPPPPPPRVISLVASSNYEFVAYTTAKVALGDACSSISTDRLSERTIIDQYDSKAVEDFKTRLRKLETNFAGLETGTTITELRIEVQDLERFAVINRFASFHQSSSSSMSSSSLRLNPKRYVTIAPMPRNIPDRVQCLSF